VDRTWWDRTSDEVSSWFGDEDAEHRREMDRNRQQSHRGKGPKGYRRSDERIKEDVSDRLTDNDALDASDVEIDVKEGCVILVGSVSDRWAKRLAEDLTENVAGVRDVENRLRVSRSSQEFPDRVTPSTYNEPMSKSTTTRSS